jgi:hypothetical protein
MPETEIEAASGALTDPFLHGSSASATGASKAKAGRIGRIGRKVEIQMPGTLDVVAGSVLTLVGFREGVDGEWLVKSVRQQISRQGWTTSIQGEGSPPDETYRKPSKTKKIAETAADV